MSLSQLLNVSGTRLSAMDISWSRFVLRTVLVKLPTSPLL
jgi:hypothetical protein